MILGSNPPGPVLGKPSTTDHAVQVRVMQEVLAPGVQHGQQADLVRAQVSRIRGHLHQGFAGASNSIP